MVFCPECKNRMKRVDIEKTDNENYICKNCKTTWLIVYCGNLED